MQTASPPVGEYGKKDQQVLVRSKIPEHPCERFFSSGDCVWQVLERLSLKCRAVQFFEPCAIRYVKRTEKRGRDCPFEKSEQTALSRRYAESDAELGNRPRRMIEVSEQHMP